MRNGYEICLEIGREADAKYPDDTDRALDFARVKAKRELAIGSDTNPWVIEQIMPTIQRAIAMARANANRVLANQRHALPSKQPESVALSKLPPEVPKAMKARLPERKLSSIAAAIVGGMAQRIGGTQLGLLRGGDLPAIVSRGISMARGVVMPIYVLDRILKSGKVAVDQQICEAMTVAEVDALFAEAEQKLPGEVQKLIA